jgi:hypothetical protein
MRCKSRGIYCQGGPLRPAIDGPGSWFLHIVVTPARASFFRATRFASLRAFGAEPLCPPPTLKNGPKYVAYVAHCGARVAGHGQGGVRRAALHDWRAGFRSEYPARVFFFRGARMASPTLQRLLSGQRTQ